MSQSYDFYMERANAAAKAAGEADLDNVRERELRSEATWLGLAEQSRRVAEERAKTEAAHIAKREEEAQNAA